MQTTPHLSAAESVTPVVLTYNEEPNIARTLQALRWAKRIVVIDSGSTDGTERIARGFPQVDWQVRRFDTYRQQWDEGLKAADIRSGYILALDADYEVPVAFLREIEEIFLPGYFAGGIARFEYRLCGRALPGSLYPPKLIVFRPGNVTVAQPGHGYRFDVEGEVYRFAAPIIHDDRKPLERFVASQLGYSRIELERIAGARHLTWRDRLRQSGVMPILVGLLAYVRAGGPFRGAAATRYAYERAVYECLLALRLTTAHLERAALTTSSEPAEAKDVPAPRAAEPSELRNRL